MINSILSSFGIMYFCTNSYSDPHPSWLKLNSKLIYFWIRSLKFISNMPYGCIYSSVNTACTI